MIVDVEKHLIDNSPIPEIVTNCTLQEKVIAGEIIRDQIKKIRVKSSKGIKKCYGRDTFRGRIEDILAKLLGFNPRESYRFAKIVCNTRNIKLIAAVDEGKCSVSFAADITKFVSHEDQDEFLKLDKKAQHDKLKQLKAQKKQSANNKPTSQQNNKTFTYYKGNPNFAEFCMFLQQAGFPFSYTEQAETFICTLSSNPSHNTTIGNHNHD